MPHPVPKFLRKIIKLPATASPNVRRALYEIEQGREPSGDVLVPTMLTWQDYQTRRKMWSPVEQCQFLDAEFYEGDEVLLYPREWLKIAGDVAEANRGKRRFCKGIGCDPAEGGDKTSMYAVDEFGVIESTARKTPNTQDIPRELLAFMRLHNLDRAPNRVCIDRGGGGYAAACALREWGYNVRTVPFGESLINDPKYGTDAVRDKVDHKEARYAYRLRRSQLYGELSALLDPGTEGGGQFGIPISETELREEMRPIPRTFDVEGRLEVIPKNPKPGDKNPDGSPRDRRKSLVGLIGHSPDRLDALALAVHAMLHEAPVVRVGAYSWGAT